MILKVDELKLYANLPNRKISHEDPLNTERRIVKQEEENLHQRQKDIDQYAF